MALHMTVRARRHAPRACLDETGYLEFASGVRGTITDVSDGGLRFTTSSPLKKQDSQNYNFTFNRGGELTAYLAWTDETRTVGGLCFQTLSGNAHNQIRAWLEQSWETRRRIRSTTTNRAHTGDRTSIRHQDIAIFTEVKPSQAVSSTSRFGRSTSFLISESSPTREDDEILAAPSGHKRRTALMLAILILVIAVSTAAAAHFYPSSTMNLITKVKSMIVRLLHSV